MTALEKIKNQRNENLTPSPGIMRSANWIFAAVREPKKSCSYCVIHDNGDYGVFNYEQVEGFPDSVLLWLEEIR